MAISYKEIAPAPRELTYEEYLRLPPIESPYDILDGVLLMSPAASSYHQWIMGEIYERLKVFVRQNRLGVVLSSPIDVVIRKRPKLRTRQPDVLYLSAARTGIRGSKELKKMPQLEIAPDLAVEILSPEEAGKTLTDKLADYAEIGVPEVWLVNIEAETIEVRHLTEKQYQQAAVYGSDATLTSRVLPEFTLSIATLFE